MMLVEIVTLLVSRRKKSSMKSTQKRIVLRLETGRYKRSYIMIENVNIVIKMKLMTNNNNYLKVEVV